MVNPSPAFRNIAFVGHPSSGKTTLIESMAHLLGATERLGVVSEGTTLADSEPEEQEKGHSLKWCAVHVEARGFIWNLIDTPGYPDFEADMRQGVYAADLVVGVVSLASGVTLNLRRKLEFARSLGKPRAILVTHPDAENADFEALVAQLRNHIGPVCVPALLPDGGGKSFRGVHRAFHDADSPWRRRLMDRVMDACEDEQLLMRYLETQELSEDELRENFPTALARGALVPILVCDPHSELGVQQAIEFLERAGPSPSCHPSFVHFGERVQPDNAGPLLGVVVGLRTDPHLGRVAIVRVQTGTLVAQDSVVEISEGASPEKIGGLFLPLGGKQRKPTAALPAGSIGMLAKVEGLHLGQSFTRPGDRPVGSLDFPAMPEPMVALAIHPKQRSDEQKIGPALAKLALEDPSFHFEHNPRTHELIVRGLSDLHLTIALARIKRRFGVECEAHTPKIAYRETLRRAADATYRHKKQSGGRGQFGEVSLKVRPTDASAGISFVDSVVGGAIPRNLIPAVEKGIRELAAGGILTHSEVVGVEVELVDGKHHAVDSDEASFKAAGARAFREAFGQAGPVLLEPIMALEIHVPSEHAGAVFGDLTSHRRGTVLDQETEADGSLTLIRAQAPLSTLATYHRDLISLTGGGGQWRMSPAHYAPVPEAEQRRVLAESARHHEE